MAKLPRVYDQYLAVYLLEANACFAHSDCASKQPSFDPVNLI